MVAIWLEAHFSFLEVIGYGISRLTKQIGPWPSVSRGRCWLTLVLAFSLLVLVGSPRVDALPGGIFPAAMVRLLPGTAGRVVTSVAFPWWGVPLTTSSLVIILVIIVVTITIRNICSFLVPGERSRSASSDGRFQLALALVRRRNGHIATIWSSFYLSDCYA